ncbi:MAG: hypothetical protein JNJ41_01460 [Bacteroidia bacterium]|nr:hypothetical protein [Bacteroidia bacterium]
MRKILYIFPFLILSTTSIAQSKKEIKVLSFDNLSKKPLECEHHYSNDNNGTYKIVTAKRSNWLFLKSNANHYSEDYRKFNHVKVYLKGYVPQIYEIKQMSKPVDTAKIYLTKMHKDFNCNFTNIVFKEDLSIDQNATKYYLNLYKEYFLGKDPRLKIMIVNVNSPFATTEESKIKAAYNLKKLLGSEERVSVKIENSLPTGNNNEVVFKVLALSE